MTADEIKAFRKDKDLTQEELAALCGVGKSAVSQWEKGVTKPSGSARSILEDYVSGRRALIPLSPLEERLLDEAVLRSGKGSREAFLESVVLDLIRKNPLPKQAKPGKK